MHNQEKNNNKKKNPLCLCLIQKWGRCKCYSVGRCESNSSQFRCCRPFSVMKIGFLVDMILLATKSGDRVTVMQMEMVKKKCPGLRNACLSTWQLVNVKWHEWPTVLSMSCIEICSECDTLLLFVLCCSISWKKHNVLTCLCCDINFQSTCLITFW